MFTPNTSSVIVAHTVDASMSLFEKVLFMFNSVPEVLRPHLKYRNRKELFFDRINSSFYVGSAETKDFGRGRTIINLHCLHPDVLVLGENGFVKKISDIGVPTKEWDGDLISINVRMNPRQPIIVTPDHNILTQSGWKRADKLLKFDKIVQPIRRITEEIKSILVPLKNGVNQFIKAKGYANLNLDKEFGWIVGIFLTEGTTMPGGDNYLQFGLNVKEELFAEKIIKFFENSPIRLKGKIHNTEEGSVRRILLYSRTWHNFFRNNFYVDPTKRHDKYIPDWVFRSTREFCDGLVNGCIDGDGAKDKTSFSSARSQLTYQLRDLLCSLGYGWTGVDSGISIETRGKPWTTGKVSESCNLRICGNTLQNLNGIKRKEIQTIKSYKREYKDKSVVVTCKPTCSYTRIVYGKKQIINPKPRGPFTKHYKSRVETIETKPFKKLRTDSAQRYKITENFVLQDIWKIEKVYYKGPVYDLINQPDHRFRTVAGIVHNCSECSSPSWSRDFLDGLLESVPSSGVVIMESTARGEGGLYFDYYFDAKNGKNEYRNHYYRWFDHLEYREPLPEGTSIEEFVASYDWDEQELVRKYRVTPYQIQWRRSKKRRLRMKFIQEYPELDDVDAFIKTGSSVFDTLWLDERDKELPEQAPAQIWLGGELFIYRIADPGAKYIIGVDTSEGDISSDFTAAMVIRIWPPPVEQVALLHGRWTPDIASEKVYKLARAYNYGLIIVERNNHGHAVLLNLGNGISRKGVNVYPPYANLYIGPDKKLGWLSTQLSKPQVIDELDRCMRAEELVINSKQYIFEARRFVTIKTGYGNKYGYGVPDSVGNDDIVLAQAIALAGVGVGKFDFSFV
jgi:intein/homing endonuclease